MTTKYPGAVWRPLSGRGNRPNMEAYNIICVHTMVGYLKGSESTFQNSDLDSHIGIGGPWDSNALDGDVWQWVDLDNQSHANEDGNDEVISIETSDGANPDRKWSPKMVESLVDFIVWACLKYKIPPVLIPDTQPGRRGLAYHRMGINKYGGGSGSWPYDKWRESGGVRWSPSLAKICPGDVRIKQFVDEVIPKVQSKIEGDMELNDTIDLKNDDGSRKWAGEQMGTDQISVGQGIGYAAAGGFRLAEFMKTWVAEIRADVNAAVKDVNDIQATVDGHSFVLTSHGTKLDEHTAKLNEISTKLDSLATGDLTLEQIIEAVKQALREGTDEEVVPPPA